VRDDDDAPVSARAPARAFIRCADLSLLAQRARRAGGALLRLRGALPARARQPGLARRAAEAAAGTLLIPRRPPPRARARAPRLAPVRCSARLGAARRPARRARGQQQPYAPPRRALTLLTPARRAQRPLASARLPPLEDRRA